jgi:hypothetical protein
MAQFNFTVDTAPMADTILTVTEHVDETTTAVIAMSAAVVKAEQESAEKICNHVNYGFYSLIRSQVSQKIAAHKSKADSKLVELHQQTISLNAIKSTLERDYQTLSSRYTKLFDGLNQSLRIRIMELDRPVMHFINKEILPQLSRPVQLTGMPSTNQSESLVTSQQIAVSNTRFNTRKNLASMQEFIRDSENQKNHISSVLLNQQLDDLETYHIPVIMTAVVDAPGGESHWQIQLPTSGSEAEHKIATTIRQKVDTLDWSDMEHSVRKHILVEFEEKLNQTQLPQRVRKVMQDLIQSADWKQLK